jgi:hypothetical protein
MLHPPYTAMVLSFVVLGAVISPKLSWIVLLATLAAYFAGLGIGAHFLDQLPGMGSRYVTHWPSWALWTVGFAGVGVGVAIGVLGALVLGEPLLLFFVVVQGLCALGYPLAPLFGGVLHRDSVFAVSWGCLPCLTSYYAQAGNLSVGSVLLAAVFAAIAVVEIRVSRRSRAERRTSTADAPVSAPGAVASSWALRHSDAILGMLSVGTTVVAVASVAGRIFLAG